MLEIKCLTFCTIKDGYYIFAVFYSKLLAFSTFCLTKLNPKPTSEWQVEMNVFACSFLIWYDYAAHGNRALYYADSNRMYNSIIVYSRMFIRRQMYSLLQADIYHGFVVQHVNLFCHSHWVLSEFIISFAATNPHRIIVLLICWSIFMFVRTTVYLYVFQ